MSYQGDLKYGSPRSNADGSISLLSHRVEFVHPVSKETIVAEAPLPDDNLWRAIAPNSKIHAYEEVCEMGRNHGVDSIGAHLLLSILLYLPPVQNWAVKQVAAYASESTGMDISVKQVRLVFPLKLGVEGVRYFSQSTHSRIPQTWL